jgi:hypothetical protein
MLSSCEFVWFLHADSRLSTNCIAQLAAAIRQGGDKLYYFDLRFDSDGPALMRLNSFGANFRSRIFQMPFGDQGFCMRKTSWLKLGRFREDLPYGEDHAFVWAWRKRNRAIERIPASITTSARKYQSNGWWSTTKLHFLLTWKQAIACALDGRREPQK